MIKSALSFFLLFLSTNQNISGTWINVENNHQINFEQKDRNIDIKWKFNAPYCGPKILIGSGVVDMVDDIGDIVAKFEPFPIFYNGRTCRTTSIVLSTKIALYEKSLYTTRCYLMFSVLCGSVSDKIKTPCHGRWE